MPVLKRVKSWRAANPCARCRPGQRRPTSDARRNFEDLVGFLSKILAQKHDDLAALRARTLPSPPERRPILLGRASNAGHLSLIAEIKRRSPSAGALSSALSIADRAAAYE